VFARALSEQLSTNLGITVIVENKPGAGGIIGSAEVARAKPNGGTLLFSSNSFVTRAAVEEKLPFDPRKSFTPIAMVAQGAMLLVVSNETPFKSVKELIAASKTQQVNYGSAGIGSIGQMAAELFNSMAGVNMNHVPYKGITGVLTDMIGGRIEAMVTAPASIGGALKGKQIRPLAVTSAQPSPFFPDLPTVAQDLPGYEVDVWFGVYGPAGMPAEMTAALNQAIREVSASPRMREVFAKEAASPSNMDVKEFAAYVDRELDQWQALAKSRGIRHAE
jgi:tripartite-type tricarboxylate transporter receptor subunit TctC